MGASLATLFDGLSTKTEVNILMVGLDCAGKTTILYRLKGREVVIDMPTVGFNLETLEYKNISFQVQDMAGQNMRPPYLKCYYQNIRGMIYVVDSNDRDRIFDARDNLKVQLEEFHLATPGVTEGCSSTCSSEQARSPQCNECRGDHPQTWSSLSSSSPLVTSIASHISRYLANHDLYLSHTEEWFLVHFQACSERMWYQWGRTS
ncbi:OLC1v1002120C2 [Oldenlandia corymbosa var. corymbosa]|uniref:ADP-ribosylation factor 1 n=1 Tax=Oldenlandia corymbosa var. corymbosa TaxID=529605 RepID=A0AAV1D9Q3_OLDCO|nr:OLC1v1002120C2 [Oldenlandia corymbosa var. corymbosa]